MPLLFLILFAQFDLIWPLKCFSGDPIFKNECTSLSYCLMIVSRSGRSQWSCDGNAFSQVSLCSTLGLQQDVEEETNLNVLSPRKRYPLISDASTRRSEIPLVRSPFESTGRYSTGYRRSNSPYSQGLGKGRCFDGGELGRICCCSTDFCNRAVSVLPDTNTFVFLSFVIVFINFYRGI